MGDYKRYSESSASLRTAIGNVLHGYLAPIAKMLATDRASSPGDRESTFVNTLGMLESWEPKVQMDLYRALFTPAGQRQPAENDPRTWDILAPRFENMKQTYEVMLESYFKFLKRPLPAKKVWPEFTEFFLRNIVAYVCRHEHVREALSNRMFQLGNSSMWNSVLENAFHDTMLSIQQRTEMGAGGMRDMADDMSDAMSMVTDADTDGVSYRSMRGTYIPVRDDRSGSRSGSARRSEARRSEVSDRSREEESSDMYAARGARVAPSHGGSRPPRPSGSGGGGSSSSRRRRHDPRYVERERALVQHIVLEPVTDRDSFSQVTGEARQMPRRDHTLSSKLPPPSQQADPRRGGRSGSPDSGHSNGHVTSHILEEHKTLGGGSSASAPPASRAARSSPRGSGDKARRHAVAVSHSDWDDEDHVDRDAERGGMTAPPRHDGGSIAGRSNATGRSAGTARSSRSHRTNHTSETRRSGASQSLRQMTRYRVPQAYKPKFTEAFMKDLGLLPRNEDGKSGEDDDDDADVQTLFPTLSKVDMERLGVYGGGDGEEQDDYEDDYEDGDTAWHMDQAEHQSLFYNNMDPELRREVLHAADNASHM